MSDTFVEFVGLVGQGERLKVKAQRVKRLEAGKLRSKGRAHGAEGERRKVKGYRIGVERPPPPLDGASKDEQLPRKI